MTRKQISLLLILALVTYSRAGVEYDSTPSFLKGTAPPAPTVTTALGTVTGRRVVTTSGLRDVDEFFGLPFAQPPSPPRRFLEPVDRTEPWGDLLATERGPTCAGGVGQQPDPISEDCLYLDIYAPVGASKSAPLPVLVWIYGGAFSRGSISDPRYHGRELAARKDAIVVTINYRLDVFGFFAHPVVAAAGSRTGNLGLLDQLSALRFVQKHIASFGGDKDKVALFGESAGAISIVNLLTVPEAKGLFSATLIQSGATITRPKEPAFEACGKILGLLGCDGKEGTAAVECLQEKDWREVAAAAAKLPPGHGGSSPWTPIVDGTTIKQHPYSTFKQGTHIKVPTLIGSNSREGAYFIYLLNPGQPVAADVYKGFVATMQNLRGDPELIGQAFGLYPPVEGGDNFEPMQAVLGESGFSCDHRRLAKLFAHSGMPTWSYHFAHSSPECHEFVNPPMGATHMTEIPFFMHNEKAFQCSFDEKEEQLSQHMMTYLFNLAATGNPNGLSDAPSSSLPEWPQYIVQTGGVEGADSNLIMRPDGTLGTETGHFKLQCDFWDTTWLVEGTNVKPGPFPGV